MLAAEGHVGGLEDAGIDVDAVIDNDDCASIMDIKATQGVGHIDACRVACSVLRPPHLTFMEIYGQGRMVVESHGKRRALKRRGL